MWSLEVLKRVNDQVGSGGVGTLRPTNIEKLNQRRGEVVATASRPEGDLVDALKVSYQPGLNIIVSELLKG